MECRLKDYNSLDRCAWYGGWTTFAVDRLRYVLQPNLSAMPTAEKRSKSLYLGCISPLPSDDIIELNVHELQQQCSLYIAAENINA